MAPGCIPKTYAIGACNWGGGGLLCVLYINTRGASTHRGPITVGSLAAPLISMRINDDHKTD
jgi:hypothetical protein